MSDVFQILGSYTDFAALKVTLKVVSLISSHRLVHETPVRGRDDDCSTHQDPSHQRLKVREETFYPY